MATIQAYTAEAFEADRLQRASDDYRAANAEAIRLSAAITPVIRMGVLAGFVATLGYGGLSALNGDLGVGSFSALVYLTQRLLWPLTRLAELTDLYQRSIGLRRPRHGPHRHPHPHLHPPPLHPPHPYPPPLPPGGRNHRRRRHRRLRRPRRPRRHLAPHRSRHHRSPRGAQREAARRPCCASSSGSSPPARATSPSTASRSPTST